MMSPKVVDKDVRKRELARGAIGVFADLGFEGASVSKIAAAVGVGKGTLYEYFESKEEMVAVALMVWIEDVMLGLESAFSGVEEPDVRLKMFVESSMEAFLADKKMIQFSLAIFNMLVGHPELMEKYGVVGQLYDKVSGILVRMMEEGAAEGVFKPEILADARERAINVLAYLDGISLHYYLGEGQVDVRKQVTLYMDGFLEGIQKRHKA
ncbi:MAG: TetR/AcrR family transcriptional regulator [Planctomycetes bacterium]|nr:TetR/AcrR family transcriptional regulator [Planctomycetota bacterium]